MLKTKKEQAREKYDFNWVHIEYIFLIGLATGWFYQFSGLRNSFFSLIIIITMINLIVLGGLLADR